MLGRIIDSARFYKLTRPQVKVGDEGVDIVLDTAKTGFEIVVIRGVVTSLSEQPYNPSPLSADEKRAYPDATLEKAQRAFMRRCKGLVDAGFRRVTQRSGAVALAVRAAGSRLKD